MAGLPFSDIGAKWFEDVIQLITGWFTQDLTSGYEGLTQELFGTPLPSGQGAVRVFSKPAESDELWHAVYEATVAGEMMVFGLLILFVGVQGRHFLRIFNVGNARGRRRAQRTGWTGAFVIVTWYWIAVLSLSVIHGLTIALLPDVDSLATVLLSILPQAAETPIITLAMAAIGALSILLLRALFFIRELLLYVFLYGMPVGVGLAYGNIPVVSRIARRLCAQFVPLAVLPLPGAMLFRGYEFLFTGDVQFPVTQEFFRYLVVISLPVVALYATWKTFRYASPLAASALGTAGKGTVLLGAMGGAAVVGGPKAAALAGTYGPKAAAGATAARKFSSRSSTSRAQTTAPRGSEQRADGGSEAGTGAGGDGDGGGNNAGSAGGIPRYRRTENDPAYY